MKSARKRGLANPERPRELDHVAGPDDLRQRRADLRGRRLVLKDHFAPRGMVRVTVVPFPFVDSSAIVPPCASTNWRVSGRPRPKRRLAPHAGLNDPVEAIEDPREYRRPRCPIHCR